jgi:ribonucleoside-diphosphate reductase alpha chain
LGEEKSKIIERVMAEGSCQEFQMCLSISEQTFVSADITAEEHVRTQAALQAFVDNSLSKTVNFLK